MTKKQRTKDLYEKIRAYVINMDPGTWSGFTKEGLAERYGARTHEVAEILARLNREGLVSQPTHQRHCGFYNDRPHCNAYLPDIYHRIRTKEEQAAWEKYLEECDK